MLIEQVLLLGAIGVKTQKSPNCEIVLNLATNVHIPLICWYPYHKKQFYNGRVCFNVEGTRLKMGYY